MSNNAIKHIVIAGGGATGWLTAAIIAAEHQAGLQVTLVESPDAAPLGVGEASWPHMRETLRKLGLAETDLIRECDATFKQGTRFNGWVDGRNHDHYFHPYAAPRGQGETDLAAAWQRQLPHAPFAETVNFQPHLCRLGGAPKHAGTPEYLAVADYGYHVDAGKFAVLLRKHCITRLGVNHVLDHIIAVHTHDSGDIASLRTKHNGAIEGDLFVDCSGLQSRLLGQHYGMDFLSQKHVLFNDSVLAVQLPYTDPEAPIASHTTATAQDCGWLQDIALATRRAVSHVYSSAHSGDEQAELALRHYLARDGGPVDLAAPRKTTFEPGYRKQFWHRNCVAIGQSAGCVEPLEAPALALVEWSAAMLSDQMPATRAGMDFAARRFNEACTYRWERVVDFLKLHYVLSQRDAAYWREHRRAESVPEHLRELLALWRHHSPSRYDLPRADEIFPVESYQYVLYGMGFRTEYGVVARRSANPQQAAASFRDAAAMTADILQTLPSNRELIQHIVRHGLPAS